MRQISVQVVQQIDVPVPQSFVQKEKVPQGMTQEVLVPVAVLQVQIVDVPVVDVPVMMQQQMPMLQKVPRTVEIPQAPQERISACIVEQVIDVPVRQNLGETTTVVKLAPHERVQQRTVEQIATDRIAVAPVVMQRQRPAIRQSQKLRSHSCRSRSRAGGKGGNWKVDRDRSAFPCRIRITHIRHSTRLGSPSSCCCVAEHVEPAPAVTYAHAADALVSMQRQVQVQEQTPWVLP